MRVDWLNSKLANSQIEIRYKFGGWVSVVICENSKDVFTGKKLDVYNFLVGMVQAIRLTGETK